MTCPNLNPERPRRRRPVTASSSGTAAPRVFAEVVAKPRARLQLGVQGRLQHRGLRIARREPATIVVTEGASREASPETFAGSTHIAQVSAAHSRSCTGSGAFVRIGHRQRPRGSTPLPAKSESFGVPRGQGPRCHRRMRTPTPGQAGTAPPRSTSRAVGSTY